MGIHNKSQLGSPDDGEGRGRMKCGAEMLSAERGVRKGDNNGRYRKSVDARRSLTSRSPTCRHIDSLKESFVPSSDNVYCLMDDDQTHPPSEPLSSDSLVYYSNREKRKSRRDRGKTIPQRGSDSSHPLGMPSGNERRDTHFIKRNSMDPRGIFGEREGQSYDYLLTASSDNETHQLREYVKAIMGRRSNVIPSARVVLKYIASTFGGSSTDGDGEGEPPSMKSYFPKSLRFTHEIKRYNIQSPPPQNIDDFICILKCLTMIHWELLYGNISHPKLTLRSTYWWIDDVRKLGYDASVGCVGIDGMRIDEFELKELDGKLMILLADSVFLYASCLSWRITIQVKDEEFFNGNWSFHKYLKSTGTTSLEEAIATADNLEATPLDPEVIRRLLQVTDGYLKSIEMVTHLTDYMYRKYEVSPGDSVYTREMRHASIAGTRPAIGLIISNAVWLKRDKYLSFEKPLVSIHNRLSSIIAPILQLFPRSQIDFDFPPSVIVEYLSAHSKGPLCLSELERYLAEIELLRKKMKLAPDPNVVRGNVESLFCCLPSSKDPFLRSSGLPVKQHFVGQDSTAAAEQSNDLEVYTRLKGGNRNLPLIYPTAGGRRKSEVSMASSKNGEKTSSVELSGFERELLDFSTCLNRDNPEKWRDQCDYSLEFSTRKSKGEVNNDVESTLVEENNIGERRNGQKKTREKRNRDNEIKGNRKTTSSPTQNEHQRSPKGPFKTLSSLSSNQSNEISSSSLCSSIDCSNKYPVNPIFQPSQKVCALKVDSRLTSSPSDSAIQSTSPKSMIKKKSDCHNGDGERSRLSSCGSTRGSKMLPHGCQKEEREGLSDRREQWDLWEKNVSNPTCFVLRQPSSGSARRFPSNSASTPNCQNAISSDSDGAKSSPVDEAANNPGPIHPAKSKSPFIEGRGTDRIDRQKMSPKSRSILRGRTKKENSKIVPRSVSPRRAAAGNIPPSFEFFKQSPKEEFNNFNWQNLVAHPFACNQQFADFALPYDIREKTHSWEISHSELIYGEEIGCGATAVVYRGMWRGTEVAIKQMRFEENDAASFKRFQSEVQILSKLRHPNLALLMGASIRTRPYFVVTEYCDGGDLFKIIHNRNQLTFRQMLKICMDISKGINYLHHSNPQVIHRDLKSLNILLTKRITSHLDEPVAKITDFGFSYLRHNCSVVHSDGKTVGTTHWMAPEILKGQPYTEKVDTYSFGILLYEILSSNVPYPATGHVCAEQDPTIPSVLRGHRPDTNNIPRSCPQSLVKLMIACWADDPASRPSFKRILGALHNISLEVQN